MIILQKYRIIKYKIKNQRDTFLAIIRFIQCISAQILNLYRLLITIQGIKDNKFYIIGFHERFMYPCG